MKTLIFNGSPRKNGDTKNLINELLKDLEGEYRMVDAHYSNIKSCNDCRWCWKHAGCSQKDEMQEIYQYIQECDNILIASPIYFEELTGDLLSIASRLQTYFCQKCFRKEEPIAKPKKGAIILVGGNRYTEKPYQTACLLLRDMNANTIYPVVGSYDTDSQPAKDDPVAVQGVREIAKFFNTI